LYPKNQGPSSPTNRVLVRFGPAPSTPPLRSPLPGGSYRAEIVSAHSAPGPNGHQAVDLALCLLDPPYAGRQVCTGFDLGAGSAWEFQSFLGEVWPGCRFGGQVEFPLDRLLGERAEIALSPPVHGAPYGHVHGLVGLPSSRRGPRQWRRTALPERLLRLAVGIGLLLGLLWLVGQSAALLGQFAVVSFVVLVLRSYARHGYPRSPLGHILKAVAEVVLWTTNTLWYVTRRLFDNLRGGRYLPDLEAVNPVDRTRPDELAEEVTRCKWKR